MLSIGEDMEQLISKQQIKEIIKADHIRIDDLFEGEELAEYRGRIAAELALEREKATATAKPDPARYLDPATNPYIKTD